MDRQEQDALYGQANDAYAAIIRRLARGYEADSERRRDLLQDIHLELWRSLKIYDHRCNLLTWVYRVAHNVGASHILRRRRAMEKFSDLETLDTESPTRNAEADAECRYSATRLIELIHKLKPLDRQLILLYLEGESSGAIAEVTGLSGSNVATKIHRIKKVLNRQYIGGATHARS